MLFFSYLIGLWFTLRTHAAVIWNAELDEKRNDEQAHMQAARVSQQTTNLAESTSTDIRDSHLYKRILGQSLKQAGVRSDDVSRQSSNMTQDLGAANGMPPTPHVVPPKGSTSDNRAKLRVQGLSEADNNALAREVAEIAATAATIASRERLHRKISGVPQTPSVGRGQQPSVRPATVPDGDEDMTAAETATAHAAGHGGHDAPNWGRVKSTVILLGATVLYAIVAEILVDTVDVVLESFAIDQKFLGITLFALVPNTTEFLVSFSMLLTYTREQLLTTYDRTPSPLP
jgi:Ca2+:H+ antiporter